MASVYGLVVGTLLSGSFAVEIITSWPGLGQLMLDALRARDVYLVAGCAAAGSVFLAAGTLLSDAALALVDPRHDGMNGRPIAAAGVLALVAAALAALARAVARAARSDHAVPGSAERAADARPRSSTTRGALARAVHLPWTRVSQLEQRYEEDRSRAVPLALVRGGRLVQSSDEARAPLLLLGADSYGRDVFSRLLFGARTVARRWRSPPRSARCSSARCSAAIAGYVGGALDDVLMRASDFVLVLPAMYVALALRSVMPLVLPAGDGLRCCSPRSSPSSARRSSRAACAAIVRIRAAARLRGGRRVARRRPRPRLLARHLLPAARGFVAVADDDARAGVHRRGGDAVVRRPRVSRPVASWGTMLQEASSIRAFADFPWLLSPAAAMFLVVLGAESACCRDGLQVRRLRTAADAVSGLQSPMSRLQ